MNTFNLGSLPPIQFPDHDPRFTYIITDWEEDIIPDCDTGEPRPYYHCQCSGFWERKFIVAVPEVMTLGDLKKARTEGKIADLYKDLYKNLVNSAYDCVLETLGYEPYGPRSLHYS